MRACLQVTRLLQRGEEKTGEPTGAATHSTAQPLAPRSGKLRSWGRSGGTGKQEVRQRHVCSRVRNQRGDAEYLNTCQKGARTIILDDF